MSAEGEYWRAVLWERTGEYAKAEGGFRETLGVAAKAKDWALVAQSWSGLLNVVGGRLARYDEGVALRLPVEVAIEQAGSPADIEADYFDRLGLLMIDKGSYDEARGWLEKALELREKLDTHAPGLGDVLHHLGNAAFLQARYDEAYGFYQRALKLREEVFGADHPATTATAANIGLVLESQGKLAEAERYLRRDLDVSLRVHGENHPDVATAYENLGILMMRMGQKDAAREEYSRALSN